MGGMTEPTCLDRGQEETLTSLYFLEATKPRKKKSAPRFICILRLKMHHIKLYSAPSKEVSKITQGSPKGKLASGPQQLG